MFHRKVKSHIEDQQIQIAVKIQTQNDDKLPLKKQLTLKLNMQIKLKTEKKFFAIEG